MFGLMVVQKLEWFVMFKTSHIKLYTVRLPHLPPYILLHISSDCIWAQLCLMVNANVSNANMLT